LIFKTLRSGSSGNALLLEWGQGARRARLLIDCGLRSQKAFHQLLEEEVGLDVPLVGVLITHAHSDHVNYSALRVIDRLGVPVFVHEKTREQVHKRHLHPSRIPSSADLTGIDFRCFGSNSFVIEDLTVTPIPLPHAPGVNTHGYRFDCGGYRLLVATDFCEAHALLPFLHDVDLIYVESNYDPELLRQYYNPASTYHMSNEGAAELIDLLLEENECPPGTIVLGHLSTERNTPALALRAMKRSLAYYDHPIELHVAPRHGPSESFFVKERN